MWLSLIAGMKLERCDFESKLNYLKVIYSKTGKDLKKNNLCPYLSCGTPTFKLSAILKVTISTYRIAIYLLSIFHSKWRYFERGHWHWRANLMCRLLFSTYIGSELGKAVGKCEYLVFSCVNNKEKSDKRNLNF